MFRKTWKQIKILIILILVLLFFPRSFLPRHGEGQQADETESYIRQNDSEARLIEYKDDNEALKLKVLQLDVINKSRKRYKAPPVKLDILASRVANKMCKEAAENNFIGHWNMAGEKPYQRYAFAGGYDHVSENAFGEWSSAKYNDESSSISSMMEAGHNTFMSERAPNDGHKKNIINKFHNFVGIGFYLSGNQFRYYEEFIDRYFKFKNIPDEVNAGVPTSITLDTDGNNYLYFLIIYYEKYPQPLTPAQINRKGSYEDFSRDVYQKIYPWELSRFRHGSSYKIPLTFSKEGLYYIQAYYDKKEFTSPVSFNTEGRTPFSGIVIRVKKGNN
jgi:uncharacterized protein YkwD